MKPIFITGNVNKFKEARAILPEIERQDIDLDELQGTEDYIAEHKVKQAYELVKKPVFVEDVSLQFEALNGLPGPYIKDFLKHLSLDQIVGLLKEYDNKNANAICTIGFYDGKTLKILKGVVNGKIVSKRGEFGFGWDPIFVPNGYDETYAQMEPGKKNEIAHRKLALKELKKFLESNL